MYKIILVGSIIVRTMYHYHGISLKVPSGVYPPSEDSLLLAEALGETARGRVLEVGTGSGIIAIFLAQKGHEVVATDINPHAVTAATDNARRNGVEERVNVVRTDLMRGIKGPFDTVVFNPPYLPSRPLGELRGLGELEAVAPYNQVAGGRGNLGQYSTRVPERVPVKAEDEAEEEGEDEPDDWLSRSYQGGEQGGEVIERFMGELSEHLAKGGRGYMVVSSLTDLKLPPDNDLEYRVLTDRAFDFERIFVIEVFKREDRKE
jgi:release factor glutamine methyltransferase